ncbi:MAG: hypothetical protein OIN85_08665 [Candidatus Methanoperedens sp.]|nr:hypothetical protein [Candidatus Methanoperedens sp.]
MNLDDLVKKCEEEVYWKNFRNYIHSFSGNFDHYKEVVKSIEEKDITKFIEICDNRIERAKVLLSDVATVLGFLMTAIAILATLAKKELFFYHNSWSNYNNTWLCITYQL